VARIQCPDTTAPVDSDSFPVMTKPVSGGAIWNDRLSLEQSIDEIERSFPEIHHVLYP